MGCSQSSGMTETQHKTEQPQQTKGYSAILDSYKSFDELAEGLRKAGLESSQLILGIDCSKSNQWTGAKSYGRGLHDIATQTPYERVINLVGPVLERFDDDNMIPVLRFGCSETRNVTCKPFAIDGRLEFHGFREVVEAYRANIPYISMSGPTTFAPLIRQAIEMVKFTKQYHILIILTDGDVTSPLKDEEAIAEASSYPLSIVAVGIGDGPFDTLETFDDKLTRSKFDNFQFVNFTELEKSFERCECPDLKLANNILMEIPEQYSIVKRLGYLG
eukprot:gnl/Chilomastix_caulleri/917.p1 GENE.gnl/Chilomastix_caulleri/917~~gnl/Chilomastix_caulleri/917.p1  ORF type:complete len:275 (+),score=67.24 gnl/Chilomastix_caulleri/917:11-835(+)